MKKHETKLSIIPNERIIKRIFWLRGKKVMFDTDLAELYDVPTRRLNEQVRRNKERFPGDFMFQLTSREMEILRSQFATSSWGGTRYLPYAFTEQGVAMLSSVLKSKRAIQINIHIMRVFTELREMLLTHKDLRERIEKMESKYDKKFRVVFEAIKQMMSEKTESVGKIGFRAKK
ncbi:MAG: DNA-binding protein [Candidatus Moranbacteria bacterium RIFCSPLOWO2_12_FULL_48_12]|nr:MAG: DNA-binding protein [Candidatus Moranbacteria bacterium RIFCSPLOWO2_12_FULL_48_12]